MFDTCQHGEFNDDWPVLCHELGHAVIWFHLGEGIGRLKCCRDTTSQLRAGVALWPRTGGLEDLLSPEHAASYAERLLAGELAARRALGNLRTTQICSKGLPVHGGVDYLTQTLNGLDQDADLAKEDITKVLTLAINNAQRNWRQWIGDRLNRSEAMVAQNWSAIDGIARCLRRKLPAVGKSRVWPGTDLIAEMQRSGVPSDKLPAVEIVFSGESGGFLTRLRRFVRETGRNGTVCRYVDMPVETL